MIKQRVWISGTLLLILVAVILIDRFVIQPRAEKKKTTASIAFPQFKPEQVIRIELSRSDKKDTLVSLGGKWVVENEGNFPADPEGAQKLLETAKNLSCDVEVSNDEREFSRFNLTEDTALEVKFIGANDTLASFYIGKRGTTYDSSYFRKAGSNQVCLTYKNLISIFDRTDDTWRDKSIFNFNSSDCKSLTIQDGATAYVLEKDFKNNKWEMVIANERKPATLWAVDGICQTLSRLKTQSFPDVPLSETGLEKTNKSITIAIAGGNKWTLLVGNKLKDKYDYYVKRADKDIIYQLSEWQINSLFKKQDELLEKEPEPQKEEKPETPSQNP